MDVIILRDLRTSGLLIIPTAFATMEMLNKVIGDNYEHRFEINFETSDFGRTSNAG